MASIRTQTDIEIYETPSVTDRRYEERDGTIRGHVVLDIQGVEILYRVTAIDLERAKQLQTSLGVVIALLERGLRGEK
ncbi:MAG: hypothetical protein EKK55_00995 [Rhodocyclaceae bacterium]|nr:MAG: hypothetical protein EKK55_00995 [Rhodocyclaceae bacterium]